jgi:hypothetical protein
MRIASLEPHLVCATMCCAYAVILRICRRHAIHRLAGNHPATPILHASMSRRRQAALWRSSSNTTSQRLRLSISSQTSTSGWMNSAVLSPPRCAGPTWPSCGVPDVGSCTVPAITLPFPTYPTPDAAHGMRCHGYLSLGAVGGCKPSLSKCHWVMRQQAAPQACIGIMHRQSRGCCPVCMSASGGSHWCAGGM